MCAEHDKKDTDIHLPKTKFPMKGNLAAREPNFYKEWISDKVYETLLEKRKEAEPYILHDGPPYANGNIHMGHTLNKVLKDIVVRYKAFKGFYTPFIPGWDCHGMPIEHQVAEKLGSKAKTMSKLEIRQKCHEYAMRFVELQKVQFERLGVMGDWENPYLTLDKDYEDSMVDIFWEMYNKGLVYKGLKPVYWCSKCETALAEAEVEHHDHSSPSVYVTFAVKDANGIKELEGSKFVIWTTTPWTLPANVGIAVHPEYEYAVIKSGNDKFVVAKKLIEELVEKGVFEKYEILNSFRGSELEHVKCSHPFVKRDSLVINAIYVTLDTGTGCVHIAPGHGHDDYVSSRKYDLPIITPVDAQGKFTDEYPEMKGEYVFKANSAIIKMLKEKGVLLGHEDISHSYPHCWRCKSPIIFRATNQWFISMDTNDFRQQALKEVDNVVWLNEWGKDRITKMVEGRPDWCVSRQRSWGVPIFVFSCSDCGESIVNEETIGKIHEMIKTEGSDGWYKFSAQEILGGDYKCPKCSSVNIEKESDIFDVWFDSGASSFAVLDKREGLKWPADLYFEGSDQYRGWFQSSLLAAVGYKGKAPYKAVISAGWVVDGDGKAMHKSLGNVIDPMELIKKSGADILRLWVASEDFTTDQPVSEEILARVTDSYRRVRNTFKFMLGAVDDFKKEDEVEYDELTAFDKYALHRLQALTDKVDKHYENFEFYKVYREYIQFLSSFLSSFYFDVVKDRLYTFKSNGVERRSAQTVIYKMLIKLTKLIAPVLAFTADEVWQFIPEGLKTEKHVQLETWSNKREKNISSKEEEEWKILTEMRDIVMKKIEDKRNENIIKHPYEVHLVIRYGSEKADEVLNKLSKEELQQIFIVSDIKLEAGSLSGKEWKDGFEAVVNKAETGKCSRCWRYVEDIGNSAEHPDMCDRCVENLG